MTISRFERTRRFRISRVSRDAAPRSISPSSTYPSSARSTGNADAFSCTAYARSLLPSLPPSYPGEFNVRRIEKIALCGIDLGANDAPEMSRILRGTPRVRQESSIFRTRVPILLECQRTLGRNALLHIIRHLSSLGVARDVASVAINFPWNAAEATAASGRRFRGQWLLLREEWK